MIELRIVPVTAESLTEYGTVPIGFQVRSRLDTATREETPVEPWRKDYDAIEGNEPARWAATFDVRNWAQIEAWEGDARLGGAVLAWNTEGVDMLEGRSDLVVVWDLRVRPERRGQGIGKLLFKAARDWARQHGCAEIKVETQDINVPACRFYAAMGGRLTEANEGAYEELEEVQLIWRYDVGADAPTS